MTKKQQAKQQQQRRDFMERAMFEMKLTQTALAPLLELAQCEISKMLKGDRLIRVQLVLALERLYHKHRTYSNQSLPEWFVE